MKKIFTSIFIFLAFLIVSSSLKAQTCWATKGSGSWGDFNVWESYNSFAAAIAGTPGSGTASTATVPTGGNNVLIRGGFTVTMGGSNRGCRSIIIQNGGKLWANDPSARRLQIGAGGTYPVVDTIQVDGVMGGQNDGLFIESGSQAQTINISGSGSIDLYRMRMPGGAAGPTTVNIDANINFWIPANYAFSAIYNPTANDNYTVNILSGKTVSTKAADGYFNSVSSGYTNYGNYTYNIYGTLDLSANTQTASNVSVNFTSPAGPLTSRVTVNVDGGVLKTGAGIKCDTSVTSTGILDFNVINGGVVDASLATNIRMGKTSNGAGGYYDMFFGVDGTGKVKLTTDAVGATFPVGINTGTTRNNCKIVNNGTSDIYSVGLKAAFDNAPVDPTKVVNRQWSIAEATAGGSDDTLRLSWLVADQASAFDPAQPIAIMQWTGTAWQNTNASISGTGVVGDPYVAKAAGFTNYATTQFGVTNLVGAPTTPTITSFTPNTGCAVANTTIVITGTNFTGATAVTIGSIPAVSFVVNSSTQITAVVGANVSGSVSVTTPSGSATGTQALTIGASTTPTFTQVPAICAGGSFNLPTTSNNSVTGTWSPSVNNTATTTYTFTPTAGQCATTASMTVTVNAATAPTFTQVPAICAGGSFNLPTTSNNSVTGTWSPAVNNTATTTYTFTPTTGQCATTTTMTVTVNAATVPAFTQVPAICAGATLSALPTTSNNSVTGTWAPALNNQATTTYTFTPTTGQCATTATMTITVNPTSNQSTTQTACSSYVWNSTTYTASGTYTRANGSCSVDTLKLTITPSVTPSFTQVSAICAGGSFNLPTTSNNSITGTWSPAVNNTATITYTFTPTTGQCATTTTMTVTVNAATVPAFTQVPAICAGATLSALPTTSNNSVTGTWAPALNNQATTTYTFTPTTGQCATTATMTITVNPTSNQSTTQTACSSYVWNSTTYTVSGTYTRANGSCSVDTLKLTITPSVTPAFTQVPAICAGGSFNLPTTSNNSVTGTWSPAVNNTATTTYTFTPTTGQCATSATMTVTVNAATVPTFTQVPAICAGATLSALPTTSNNSVTGTWAPALNNQATTTYTFTPTTGQCATTATMTITVNPTSNQSTTQTACGSYVWNSTTYTASGTYTRANGSCSVDTLKLTITPSVTPTFTQVSAICAGGTFNLPTTSNNSITGTWSPAVNNAATTTYTFTPTTGQCATTTTMTVTVNAATVPTFTQIDPITIGGTFTLPTTSNNSITGTWAPAVDNQATTTYTFTPTTGQCATTATMTVVVNDTNTTVTPTAVVYPNPTSTGIVTINWKNAKIPNNTKVLIAVYDRAGKIVCKKDFINSGDGTPSSFDIKGASNGLYFIRIQTADKSIKYSTKILKAPK